MVQGWPGRAGLCSLLLLGLLQAAAQLVDARVLEAQQLLQPPHLQL